MGLGLKILLGLVALSVVLGGAFYVWMWFAWTPKSTTPEVTHVYKTIKEGALSEESGVTYKISAGYEFSWPNLLLRPFLSPETARFYSVYITRPEFGANPSLQTKITSEIVHTEGSPAPVDVKIVKKGVIEVFFDTPLQHGRKELDIAVDDDFYYNGIVFVANGVVKSPAQ